MKPNPLASLNHFTVPCSIVFSRFAYVAMRRQIEFAPHLCRNQTCSHARCLHISTLYFSVAPRSESAPPNDHSHLEPIQHFSDGDATAERHDLYQRSRI